MLINVWEQVQAVGGWGEKRKVFKLSASWDSRAGHDLEIQIRGWKIDG